MMTKVDVAVKFMEDIASDNSHGYSQQYRWGPDYDCSSLIISAWQYAGVPVRESGATFTGNMLPVFLSCGFYDVTADVNLNNGNGMKHGDVLLNIANHTAMYIGNGRLIAARSDEGHPEQGDQGREICEQNYYNFPWDVVLRYPQEASYDGDEEHPVEQRGYRQLHYPMGLMIPQDDIKAWQQILVCWGYDLGRWGVDGEFGVLTMQRTKDLQRRCGIEKDGIVGEETWQQGIMMPK